MPAVFCWICASTWVTASPHAARTMSCNISTSPATSGSILMLSRFFWPSMVTVTMPPPAVALTLISAISCCIFSCICCAWRIICCIFTLPGSFTFLLLEVANFAYFAAEDFAETPHFRVGKRAARGFILGFGIGWLGSTYWCHSKPMPMMMPWASRLPTRKCGVSAKSSAAKYAKFATSRSRNVKLPGNVNMQQMMRQAQQMQEKMQQDLAMIKVTATAGGGMVTVTMDGQKNLLSVKIDPEVAGDVEMLQDMVLAACGEAVKQVEAQIQQKMGGMLGGMGLPPGMF